MHETYLANMGIQTWQSRQRLPGAKQIIPANLIVLLNQNQPVADLLIAYNDDNEKTNTLLDAMLFAIDLQQGESYFIADLANYSLQSSKPLLVLGDVGPCSALSEREATFTHHPAVLLAKPELKAEAWQVLKRFKLAISGSLLG